MTVTKTPIAIPTNELTPADAIVIVIPSQRKKPTKRQSLILL